MNLTARLRASRVWFALLLLLVAFAAASCSNPEKAKAEHVRQGEAYLADRRFQEAVLEFRSAIQIDDQLAAAHWGLARAYEGLERYIEAFEEMRRTIELDPNNLEARVKLGNYYVVASQRDATLLDNAEQQANEVLARDPNYIEAHILMGSILFARNKREEAFAALRRAIEIDPQRIESHLSLAQYYARSGNLQQAEQTFHHAISLNAQAALAHLEYGKFLAQLNRAGEAEQSFRRAVEADPNHRNARHVLASFYLFHNRMAEAEEAYKALAALDGDRPEGPAILADFYATVGRHDDAINHYQQINARWRDYTRGRYRLGELMLQRGDVAGAQAQAEEVLRANSRDMEALLLQARVNLHKGLPRKAIEDLTEVLRQEPTSRAGLYFMTEAQFRAGQTDQARAFAGDLERFYPDYLPAKLMQVQINLAAGDAQTALRLANELHERLNTAVPNAFTSQQMLEELRAKTLTARGTAHLQLNNLAAARADMQAARERAPNTPASYVNLAAVALRENRADEAAQHYERALQLDGANFDALGGMIDIYHAQNRRDLAHARVDQALAARPNQGPDEAPLHFLKAKIYGYEQNPQGAEASLRRALELDPSYASASYALGALYINTRQQERALAEYQTIANTREDPTAYIMMGMLEDSRQNYAAAVEHYRRALERDANNAIAANNLAWLAAEHGQGNLDEAMALAQRVVQRFPDEPGFADTLGWVYYKKGLHAAAVEQLQRAVTRAVARGADSATYRYHLALALIGKGDQPGARRELQQALRVGEQRGNFPQADEARRTLAQL